MAEKKDNVTSKFKDNVFCMLYRDKRNLLELYNALNNSAYTNVDDLQVTTLNGGFSCFLPSTVLMLWIDSSFLSFSHVHTLPLLVVSIILAVLPQLCKSVFLYNRRPVIKKLTFGHFCA